MVRFVENENDVCGVFILCVLSLSKKTPVITELQRSMYEQMTGKAATPRDTPELQLLDLKTACTGIRTLCVLDDVWDASHCKYLDCLDSSSGSKLLVTVKHSRIFCV